MWNDWMNAFMEGKGQFILMAANNSESLVMTPPPTTHLTVAVTRPAFSVVEARAAASPSEWLLTTESSSTWDAVRRVPGNSPLTCLWQIDFSFSFDILNCRQLAPPSVYQERVIFFGVRKSLLKVSLVFSHRARCLAQKHAKKQHLYIENGKSGPNMQTSTSLTFFTAIFVPLGGALAEELMICCRHVRTELYI